MALRIADSVVRVEIDNRTRGIVTGEIWLLGREGPVHLSLSGNCLKDIAGCNVVLENPAGAKDVTTAKGLKKVNPRHVLTWEIDLGPGDEKTLSYVHQLYVRS